eukprot:CAMPEP_0116923986 /NCGR_PEP_ID=MMETSP0467-20121206/23225_1 /TAXON_ID=283647 /ORGANISM="Mesodinium pulex, Strain SPMC105" /LENGTH=203 /DNA_ID=CAMNT_0004602695 /DNA_START=994 /DNA_END=1605 /DNA_ORIENTATION=-
MNAFYRKHNLLNNPSHPSEPVISAWINQEQHFGFVELRTEEEATSGLKLTQVMTINNHQLKIGRPKKSGPHVHRTNYTSASDSGLESDQHALPLEPELIKLIANIDLKTLNISQSLSKCKLEPYSLKQLKEMEHNLNQGQGQGLGLGQGLGNVLINHNVNQMMTGSDVPQLMSYFEFLNTLGKCKNTNTVIFVDIVSVEDSMD